MFSIASNGLFYLIKYFVVFSMRLPKDFEYTAYRYLAILKTRKQINFIWPGLRIRLAAGN